MEKLHELIAAMKSDRVHPDMVLEALELLAKQKSQVLPAVDTAAFAALQLKVEAAELKIEALEVRIKSLEDKASATGPEPTQAPNT